MKRHLLIIAMLLVASVTTKAAWYSVNYDKKTVAAMVSAYGIETAAEAYYSEQVAAILDHYTAAEVAAAGIYMSKWLDRKAMTDLGIWKSADENFYYCRIYNLVSAKIMPKIWTVAGMMLHSPQTALYWGGYLYKVCAEVESLCMQFESVVTNSTLSFKDIVFLQIAPDFQRLFKLSEAGGIDWKTFFDDLGSIPHNFTKENLKTDIDNLYNMGVSIATAGTENVLDQLLGGSSFSDVMSGKIPAIANAIESSYDFYKQLDSDLGGTVLSMLGGTTNVSQLFSIDNYNMTAWMTDYMRETMGQYYTQRWYIYRQDSGSETLCRYTPATDDNSIIRGDEWTRFNTTDTGFYPNSTQLAQVKSNSESHAGWSQSRVNQLNSSQSDYSYRISYSLYAYTISKKGKQYQKSYAYAITVVRSWNHTEEVYEDIFDSYSMDLSTFQAMMNARLADFNDNEEGYKYRIGSDAKKYYQATNEAKLKGCESVIISVTCHDGYTLMQGNTQYKCSGCGGSLNNHSKECAMKSTLSGDNLDTSELDELEQGYNEQIASLNQQIASLEQTNADIVKQIAKASVSEAAALRQKYNENKSKIADLNTQLAKVKQQLADVQQAKAEAAESESEQTDDYYRIPAIMQDCKTSFDLKWQDEGHWEGYTYVRTATSGGMNAIITFKATLSIARKPKYFLGIKIHRAILAIAWELTAESSDTNVVDILQLDPNKSEKENAQTVNNRISEIAQAYPSCEISTEYIKNEPAETDNTTDTYHLLWSSDRLEIARSVDARLTQIYADLVSLEKMMHYKLSIVDALKGVAPHINDTQGKKLTILEEAFKRWMENADLKREKEGGTESP